MRALIKLNHIYKYYGDLAANQDINLEIFPGTIHAIVGENGAGKSTLMNILSGVVRPSKGTIELDGKEITIDTPNDATRLGMGMVHQEFMLFDELTALENIIIGHEDSYKDLVLDTKTSIKKVRLISEQYKFKIPFSKKIRDLPIAVQQQVEIVKVLFKDASVIILDEPTAVLTPQGIEGLFAAMRNLVKNGKTILFITHKLKEVLEISDRITVLKDGKVVDTVDTKLTDEGQLAKMMVGREVFLKINKPQTFSAESRFVVNDLWVSDDRGQKQVRGVNLKVGFGEIVGLVGVAGNGQVELIEALTGLRKVDSGSIRFKDEDLGKMTPRKFRCRKIGYVPQDRRGTGSSVTSDLIENTMIGKHLFDFRKHIFVDKKAAEDFTNEVVQKYDVKKQSINDLAGSLSGGNLQKLIVGREFSQNNEMLIIEDPTRGIDIGSMEFVWSEIINRAKAGNGCLLVTYDLNEAIQLSDRIVVMYEGKIVAEFSRDQFDENVIGRFMLGGRLDEAY